MTPASRKPDEDAADAPRMGSEYSTAQRYLARQADGVPRKPGTPVPAHGSNDSDFAGTDPLAD